MGLFDLQRGEIELLMDGEWKSVEFTDRPTNKEIADCVERWSKNHDVTMARYNSHTYKNESPVIVWDKFDRNICFGWVEAEIE